MYYTVWQTRGLKKQQQLFTVKHHKEIVRKIVITSRITSDTVNIIHAPFSKIVLVLYRALLPYTELLILIIYG